MELKLQTKAGVTLWTSGQRVVGAVDTAAAPANPVILPKKLWPEMMTINFARPTAKNYTQLSDDQKLEVRTWLGAALLDLFREADVDLTPQQRVAKTASGIADPKQIPTTPTDMDSYLKTSNRAGAMYDALLGENMPKPKVRLSPPRFKISVKSEIDKEVTTLINTALEKATPPNALAASYLYVWWYTLCEQMLTAGIDPDFDQRKFNEMLGRYFGFGERLRWPQFPGHTGNANTSFMICQPNSKDYPEKFETNAASFCELVFRVPIDSIAAAGDGIFATLAVAGKTLSDDGAETSAEKRFGPHLVDAINEGRDWNAHRRCHATMAYDLADPQGNPMPDRNGLVFVQPRAAACPLLKNAPAQLMQATYVVPTTLIDLADATPRTSIREDGEGLVVEGAPRRALLPAECLTPDKALDKCTRGWRIRADIKPAAVTLSPRAAGEKKGTIFEIVCEVLSDATVFDNSGGALGSESQKFGGLLRSLLNRKNEFQASLWVATDPNQPLEKFPLAEHIIDPNDPVHPGRLWVIDPDFDQGLQALLDKRPDKARTPQVDLVIERVSGKPDPGDELPFNLVFGPPNPQPWIALNRNAISRVSRSSDRWIERFHLTPDVQPSPSLAGSVQGHLHNFNKTRVYVTLDGRFIPVTYPDAVVPLPEPPRGTAYKDTLPWQAGLPRPGAGSNTFSFFVGHLFTQEIAPDTVEGFQNSSDLNDRDSETIRYLRYWEAHPRETVSGYVEHQYSYRIPIIDAHAGLELRLATDLRNPGDLAAHAQAQNAVKKVDAANQELAPFLQVSLPKSGGVSEKLVITASVAYLIGSLTGAAAGNPTDGSTKPSGAPSATNKDALRNFYEALQDAVMAIAINKAVLACEIWSFDNDLSSGPADLESNQSIGYRLLRIVTGRLVLGPGVKVGIDISARLSALLPPTFQEFEKTIVILLAKPPEATIFDPINIPVADPAWSWTDRTGKPLPKPPYIGALADAVRVGLELRRDQTRTVDPAVGGGRYLALSPPDAATAGEHEVIPDWIQAGIGTVIDKARAELTAYLAPPQPADPRPLASLPLYFRHSWLHALPPRGDVAVEPPPGGSSDPKKARLEPLDKRYRSIFGELASQLLIPEDQTLPVTTVSELYYVPFGYLPLATHPAVGSPAQSFDFTCFLLEIAGDLLAGRPVAHVDLAQSASLSPIEEAANARLRLQALLQDPSIQFGKKLSDLLKPVHDARLPDLVKDPAQRTLVSRVASLLAAADPTLRSALGTMFSRQPDLFVSTRAVGVGLFGAEAFSSSLQSLQLIKRVRAKSEKKGDVDMSMDVHRFVVPPRNNGPRFIVDPLEENKYDSEFEIPMNEYASTAFRPDDPFSVYQTPVVLNDKTSLKKRGGAAARRGEDFIEAQSHFPITVPSDPPARGIEADVPHWNPNWISVNSPAPGKPDVTRRLYLLPSRAFPQAPVTIEVATAQTGARVVRSDINLPRNTGSETDRDKIFQAQLRASLAQIETEPLIVGGQGVTGANQAKWLPNKGSLGAVAAAAQAEGWHQIDTYLEHHYFMVEAGEDPTADDPFANDEFEIDVLVRREGKPLPPEPIKVKTLPKLNSPLWNWFSYDQALQSATPGSVPGAPPAITLPSLVDSVVYWLGARDAANLPGVPGSEIDLRGSNYLLKPFDASTLPQDELSPTFRSHYAFQSNQPALVPKITPNTPGPRIGAIIACVMYEPDSKLGGAALAVSTKTRIKRLLRVSILADPWSRIVMRVRILRNARELDFLGSDIDPAFVMPSEYSNLSGYAHEKDVKDFNSDNSTAPPEQTRLLVETVSLKEWLDKRLTNPPDLGNFVENQIESKVLSGPYFGSPMWSTDEMLKNSARRVVPVFRQRIHDHHIYDDGRTLQRDSTRDLVHPRTISDMVSIPEMKTMVQQAAPTSITAGRVMLDITWLDTTSQSPVFEVIWPIQFARTI